MTFIRKLMKLTLRLFSFYSILFLLTAGCNHRSVEELDDDLIEENILSEILAEIQLVESSLKVDVKQQELQSDTVALYQAIFNSHNTNKEIFEKSMQFYANDAGKLEEIYDKVIVILSEKQAKYETKETTEK